MYSNLCFNLIKNTINHPATASLGTELTSSLLYLSPEKDGPNFETQETHRIFRTVHILPGACLVVIILIKRQMSNPSLMGVNYESFSQLLCCSPTLFLCFVTRIKAAT